MEEDLATSVKKEFEIVTHASEGEALRPSPPTPLQPFYFFKWHLLRSPSPPTPLQPFYFLSGTSSALVVAVVVVVVPCSSPPPQPPLQPVYFLSGTSSALGGVCCCCPCCCGITSEVTSLSDNERRGAVPRNVPLCEASAALVVTTVAVMELC